MVTHKASSGRHSKESKPSLLKETEETSICKYQDDTDFDEAFKNLLRPIELIAKINHYEYNLIKELDSYLFHLRRFSKNDPINFVEAALMFQNIILIYQKRVDYVVDYMMKLVGKFRAYRINQNENEKADDDDSENMEGNKKKKKEKKVKYYPSFEPIKGQIFGTLKNFDCKEINLTKMPVVPKIVLNANIKVDNKYNQILPYISIGNGENIGKKYEFMINFPLNRDLAVNEEFDCPTNEDQKNCHPLIFCKSTDPLPMNLMNVDQNESVDKPPSTPDPVIFNETFAGVDVEGGGDYGNETAVEKCKRTNDELLENCLNVSQIPVQANEDAWGCVQDSVADTFADKPIIKKKNSKKEEGVWLPTYVVSELCVETCRIKSKLPVDPAFQKFVREVQERQKSEMAKEKFKQARAEEKKKFGHLDEELEEKLRNNEIAGFEGFDILDYNSDPEYENNPPEIGEPEVAVEDFLTYKKNMEDMRNHEQNQLEIMNEQLEMRKRVQIWHDNLRPILEEEEKRTAFDIHEYGTRVLNCFDSIGEQKSFEELIKGQEQGEVARYFLSTLMMANTYNLKIMKSSDNPLAVGDMKIELLKKERHHEELQINIGNQVNQ